MAEKKTVGDTKAAKASPPTPAASASTPSPPAASTPAAASSAAPAEDMLETRWTFWMDKKLSRADANASGFTSYAQNLRDLGSFDSVQSFWRHYSHLQVPDQLPRDFNYYLFRNNEIPAWETFPEGGSWIIKVRKGNGVINRLWEELCFACIGEWFEEPDVVGVALSTRNKDDNIAVWNRGPDMNARIGERLKDLLNLDESTSVEYKAFKSAMQDNSSFRNAKQFTYAPVAM